MVKANSVVVLLGDITCPEKFDFSIYTSYAHGVFGNPITLFRFRMLKIDFE